MHKQHFLLSTKAHTLSVKQVMEMTEVEAFEVFKEIHWGAGEEVACPVCGVVERHYFQRTRRQWRCKACNHTFSVTSGTIFAFHKLPLKVYLAVIALYANAVKGISALQLSRDLGVQYKTAFVLAHKIRESLMEHRDDAPLAGEVHMDGAYVNGHIRPKNKKAERIDRRLAKHQKPSKRCVFVMRQKCEELAEERSGAAKTLTFVIKNEKPPMLAWRTRLTPRERKSKSGAKSLMVASRCFRSASRRLISCMWRSINPASSSCLAANPQTT
jgi:transposase-like protein